MTPTATFNISPRDRELANCITASIRRNPLLWREPICVDVRDGHATLRGTVSRYAAKVAACEAATDVQGIASMTSDLVVQIPLHLRRTDAEIRDVALAALRWKACLPAGSVDVSVRDGHVTLAGRVDWSYQRKLAEEILEPLQGVTSISNELDVSDRQIQMEVSWRIRAALRVAAEAQADAIEVEARNGTVTLRGILPTASMHTLVRSAADGHPEVHE